ncbi:MAG: ATP-binding cassette domain-containing protein [Bacteroidota bacterium]|nr:ATP-binding cassette domain-containing protein [Bacteroidota bacterium]MDP4250441.1 ATP-binding cassette domain-containing protein [Bacteroidota bacterium]
MASILSLNNITKSYGKIQALKGVSFDVPQGSVFGILGPNGSGKTTLLGVVMDVLKPNGGNFRWFGEEPSDKQRRKIGTLLETPNFYHYLSGERNLQIAAAIKQKPPEDVDRVVKLVRLYERRQSKFQTYSLGMKQRLAIASCLLGNPSVLVFDEPTNGLDPSGIAEIRELIIELSKEGKTIILASHLLAEVEKVCTHVSILQQGTLIASGSVHSVLSNEEWLELGSANPENLRTLLNQFPGIKKTEESGDYLLVFFESSPDASALNQFCFEHGVVLSHLQLRKKSLEAEFIALTHNVSS